MLIEVDVRGEDSPRTSVTWLEILPGVDCVGRLHDVHTGVGEFLEGLLGVVGVVREETALRVRHGDRRHAVAEQIDLLRERRVLRLDLREEVGDGRLHAVRGRLAADDDSIGLRERLDEPRVLLAQGALPVVTGDDLGTQHRIVLGQWMSALDLGLRLHSAQERVELAGLFNDTDERVPIGAEDAMERPDIELVLAVQL